MSRSHPHRSTKAVETLTAHQKVAQQRLSRTEDLHYLCLLWLDASPKLRLSLIEEFATVLGMESKHWKKVINWLQGPTRKFQRQRGSWHSPRRSEAEHEELLETQWMIVLGNNNAVCQELTVRFLDQLPSLPDIRKDKIKDYFQEAYIAYERGRTPDAPKPTKTNRGPGAPKREERADRIKRAMLAATVRYFWDSKKSWTQIGWRYFGLKSSKHARPGNTLQRDVKWLSKLVYDKIVNSIWTWAYRNEEEKEQHRQRIACEWENYHEKALDRHLGLYSLRSTLRRKFSFPHLRPKRGMKITTAELRDRDERLLTFLAKTLFHIGRTGKLTVPEPFRPKQPF